ncbi:efflux RND transporter periplasmic adaptor subunit [Mucilaginibacter paludis]|uniref:Efflux transporter, RND family, MFP subunit n=1 Tax=Mucilaginibacter paludis DSM 18603 TaxID=714943 RepID=H1YAM4_9SPHI|nr:efflux RND transporter periplasmic adaptor subunit [Mucilaginibacter paludis]EHQ29144.1 efflux transporter, RND family, MFP subunit [Mucilaginibacter paludis DSM 18603]
MKREAIIVGLSAIIFLAACKEQKKPDTENKQVCITDSLAKIITMDTVKMSTVKDELSLSGQVSFDDNHVVKIYPFSSGQVVDVKVSLGDRVSQGQTLATIKSADVAGNYSDLSSAKSDVSITKRQLAQTEYLYKSGIASERDYTEAQENYNKALAANRKIEQQISINGHGSTNASGQYVIKAPTSGYIVERTANPGSFIRQDNAASLFTISDMKDVWIWANVFESDIAKVKKGYDAKVTTLAYPDKVFSGKVNDVSSVLDPENKVMKVKITLPNKDMLLKPEMFTNVVITNTEGKQSVAIPAAAVIFDSSKNYVVVYKDKCHLEIREVSVIKTVDSTTYIASGLKPGEILISKNQLLLYNALAGE